MEEKRSIRIINKYIIFSFRDFALMLLWMGLASGICVLLQTVTENDNHVPLIFVLAVFVTSITTNGYLYGIIASIFSVFFVNWAFTYPYLSLDFTIVGYPLTFITMLTVSMATCTLTSMYKKSEALRRYSDAEKTRANLLRSISHDLRTPLTAIIGDAEMVMANEEKEENKVLLNDIGENAEGLVRLVENILSITRMEGQVGDIAKTDEIPEEIVGSIIEKFKSRNPSVEFITNFPDEVFFVPMDQLLIGQLFMNLFENAVKHGNASKIFVTSTKADGYVRFDIKDNGTGIPSDKESGLFDGSLQYKNEAVSDANKFMGIGLMVCKTIALAHGGSISGKNTEDGAEFSFTIKLDEDRTNGTKG